MGNMIKSGNAILYVTLALLLALAGVYRLGDTINERLKAAPIKTVQRSTTAAVTDTNRQIYPVWVVQDSARAATPGAVDVEAAFGAQAPTPVQLAAATLAPAAKQTRAELFQQVFVINGYGYDGIFVGTAFYRSGEVMELAAFDDADGVRVVPRLIKATNGSATIDLGGQTILIKDRIGAARGNS